MKLPLALVTTLLATTLLPCVAAAQDDDEAAAAAEMEGMIPHILVIPERSTPRLVTRELRALYSEVGELVDTDDFVRQARARGLRPERPEAVPAVFAENPRAVQLVVVISRQRRVRRRLNMVQLQYRSPSGETILEEVHILSANRLGEDSGQRILGEARLALAALSGLGMGGGPGGAPPQLPEGMDPRMLTNRGTAVHVGIAAGAGIGTRNISVATAAGALRMDTVVFPAVALQLGIAVEPTALGQLAFGAQVEYRTSVGLTTSDVLMGETRQTDTRSHLVQALAFFSYRFAERDPFGPFLLTSLGWSSRLFSTEAPVSMPDFGLGGLLLSVGLWVPVERQLLTFTLAPEVQWLVDVSSSLQERGVGSMGVAIGGTARVTLKISNFFFLQLAYRESHALIDGQYGQSNDGERFVTLRAFYRP